MHFGFLIESMVSILLLLTILYCVRLSKQLRLLRADEQSLRATIAELVTATEIAERAIAGLKSTMRDGEQALGGRIVNAEQLSAELSRQLQSGEDLMGKLARIAGVARPGEAAKFTAAPKTASDAKPLDIRPIDARPVDAKPIDAKSVAAAAQAFAERANARIKGHAA